MEGNKITSDSIDEYIIKFSPEIQEILKMLRKVIEESAPDADEWYTKPYHFTPVKAYRFSPESIHLFANDHTT